MYKVTIHTEYELSNIKQPTSKYNFRDISNQLGLIIIL